MEQYNLFLDDFRMPVDAFNYTKDTDFNKLHWTIVRNYKEFVEYISKMYEVGHFPSLVAFDHDLGLDVVEEKILSGMSKIKALKNI